MGFYFEDGDSLVEQPAPDASGAVDESAEGIMAPEDELQGMDIPSTREDRPAGAYVIELFDEDKVSVNAVELKRDSKLADWRAACTFHHLPTIGGAFVLQEVGHQTELELELIDAAADMLDANVCRDPPAPTLAVAPRDPREIEKHNLTHPPYAPWCSSCVCV
eukprot:s3100_g12.t1